MSLTPSSSSTAFAAPTPTSTSSGTPLSSSQPSFPSQPSSSRPQTQLPPTSTSTSTFDFPREYHFPPFFTRQSNLTTLHSQLEKWSSLILSYCRYHRLFKLSLSYEGAAHEDLFYNRRISRRLSLADAREVLDFMRREGRAEAVGAEGSSGRDDSGGGGGDVFWVYWRTPEEWAGLLEDWVETTAQKGTVLTLYELTEGEGARGAEFHGLEQDLLLKALQVLVKRGKAQIFGQEDQQGVKFF